MKQDLLQKIESQKQAAMRRVAARSGKQSAFAPRETGFTLVELLVVIAITTILLGLLFGPIISSFNLTRRARAVAQAQDAARFGLERLSRELSQATYIYDNEGIGVVLPISYQNVPTQGNAIDIGAPPNAPNDPTAWEIMRNARIDLVLPSTRQNNADVIDPTTGQPVGGPELQPGVRGRRAVRYFLGLRFPRNADGSQRLYANRYEFTTGSRTFNPVILYRAEYDPRDPNLFDLDAADYVSKAVNGGGFNDPDFFYSTKQSNTAQRDSKGNPANGRTYGENWQAISQPVLVSENMDLIRWNRVGAATNRNEKDAANPFTPTVAFKPATIVADVATAGTLSSGGVETPAAVPTVYKTKYGAWSYPFTVTVLRGSTNSGGGGNAFGRLTFTVDRAYNPGRDQETVGIRYGSQFINNGTMASDLVTNVFTVYSPTTHKLYVKTNNLTFAIDTDRGRIETGLPPLMGVRNNGIGIPYYVEFGRTNPAQVAIEFDGPLLDGVHHLAALGEVVPLKFMVDSRYPRTGTEPTNLGLFTVNLFADNYAFQGATIPTTPPLLSPLGVFGNVNSGGQLRGVRIIPGTERVIAPIAVEPDPNNLANTRATLASWVRTPAGGRPVQPDSRYDAGSNTFTAVPERRPTYGFDYDIFPAAAADPLVQLMRFTESDTFNPADLADLFAESGMAASTTPNQQFLTVDYLWQNNFSRDPATGQPLDANGGAIGSAQGTRPEADIFRVDYSTREQYSISLGARIYDPTDGRVQSLNVSDKVIINNVIR